MKFTVVLEDETVGYIDSKSLNGKHVDDCIGQVVKVHLHDENGNPIEASGRLVEVLEESEF
ncbi:hypothetical protein QRC94_003853 [Vibrio vulnificus]|uniref:hypothetical protein n=1 Tax=Vibrio vulnificus TaxID=672 RepID=UPI000CCFF6FA|nr:hypothetical protein [Vibrio vulnificus]EKQ3696146.1 hypothetical protein [Vibrio vulnificus]ELR8548031.1 hypothetical protein [Vibrio vulnificus]ELR8552785.1 hypothetical protein [Vibrio vulnificus]POB86749.1 hypothetical protein CRN40_11400 [Vibrio vulnificus]